MRLLSLVFGALGLLSMLYGLAVLGTASGTSFWMVWEGAGLLALILAILFFSRIWIRIPALFRYAFWVLVLAGALWILICCGLMVVGRLEIFLFLVMLKPSFWQTGASW